MQSEVDEINPVTQEMYLLKAGFNLTVRINHAWIEIKTKQEACLFPLPFSFLSPFPFPFPFPTSPWNLQALGKVA